jgi:hypothetical protein
MFNIVHRNAGPLDNFGRALGLALSGVQNLPCLGRLLGGARHAFGNRPDAGDGIVQRGALPFGAISHVMRGMAHIAGTFINAGRRT